MKKYVENAVAGYNAEIEGKPTFPGCFAMNDFLPKVLPHCSDSTRKNYMRDYRRIIFPVCQDLPIDEIDFEKMRDDLESIFVEKEYRESTKAHYRYLVRAVFETAAEEGLCKNPTFASSSAPRYQPADPVKEIKDRKKRTRRVFSAAQEVAIYLKVSTDPLEDGEKILLAAMYETGARNQELCGMNFRDIWVDAKTGKAYLCVINATAKGTNQLKGRSKTPNAHRLVPISHRFYINLLNRKNYIKELCADGSLETGPDIEDYPLGCVGHQWTHRATSAQVTEGAKQLFQEIQMSEQVLARFQAEMEEDPDDPVFGNYKDVTAYCFRRNFANHCYVHLSTVQIQYVMGHAFSDQRYRRSDFVNSDELRLISTRLENRPIINDVPYQGEVVSLGSENVELTNKNRIILRIPMNEIKNNPKLLKIFPNEIYSTVTIRCRTEKSAAVAVLSLRQTKGREVEKLDEIHERSVNILPHYWEPYIREMRKSGLLQDDDTDEHITLGKYKGDSENECE